MVCECSDYLFGLGLVITVMMATTTRKCQESKGRTCNCFHPAIDKDLHELCTVCCSQQCSIELVCVCTARIGQQNYGKKRNLILLSKLSSVRERRREKFNQSLPLLLYLAFLAVMQSLEWFYFCLVGLVQVTIMISHHLVLKILSI